MLFKKCFGSNILRFAQIYEGGIYYLALTYFLKNSNNFLTDTRKYYEKRSTSYHANYKVAIVLVFYIYSGKSQYIERHED